MSQEPARDDRVAHGTHPRRVLLKLSGEVFGGGSIGLDSDVVSDAARQIAEAVRAGVQVSVVVGGGNFFRGAELSSRGMDRARADYMGMLGTVMNALALQDFIEKAGVPARVQTAIAMGQVAESYIPLRAIRHMEKNRVVVFGAGAAPTAGHWAGTSPGPAGRVCGACWPPARTAPTPVTSTPRACCRSGRSSSWL